MRWIFTGGSDGYIRRFDWFGSINGRVPLTVAQRHPFVDSVTRAGILLSYWENEEPVVKSEHLYIPETTDDLKLSPVYSLAVQNQSLWLLSGLESGGINLQSVRHDEGKIITTLRKHTSAVSVLTLSSDERSLLSGSWDRNVYDWDLNTGQTTRDFLSNAGQVSSIAFRPNSDNWQEIKKDSLINGASGGRRGDGGEVDEMSQAIASGSGLSGDTKLSQNGSGSQKGDDGDITMGDSSSGGTKNSGGTNGVHNDVSSTNHIPTAASSSASTTDQNVFLVSSMDGTFRIWDRRQLTPVATSTPSKGVPPWCMDACWSTDGNFVYVGRRNGTVEEFNVHKGVGEPVRTMRFPMGSGPVSALAAMPNGRHLICASFDNLRLYDLSDQGTKSTVPFLIIPGHHGGVISSIYVDTTCQYMISTAGNRGWEGASTEVLLGYEIIMQP
ncbi:WD40-repeat-containing domain protein [Morchella snyderi]|nr:WD40-repeat-containing domain protein [Morchella snyderi]